MSTKYVADIGVKKGYSFTMLGGVLILVATLVAMFNYMWQPGSPQKSLETVRAANAVSTTDNNYGLPVRLQIPSLEVDATVIYLGINKAGDMDIPSNIADIGWYKHGALPGNKGTAVLAGHLNGSRGEPGVFSGISKLVAGDKLVITDTNDRLTTFVVRETRSYGQDEKPEEVFNSSSGTHLNLITCSGEWNSSKRQFSKRLVVFTDVAS